MNGLRAQLLNTLVSPATIAALQDEVDALELAFSALDSEVDSNRANSSWGTVSGGYVQITSNVTGITTIADVTGLSITFTAVASRRYRIDVGCMMQTDGSTANNQGRLYITDGSNNVLQRRDVNLAVGALPAGISATAIVVPGAGSVTYKARAERSIANNLSVIAAATIPAFILITDIGL